MSETVLMIIAGSLAGLVNGIFGAGGGMILLPMLSFCRLEEERIFPTCVSIILPICITSLIFYGSWENLIPALPYMVGGSVGGIAAGKYGSKIRVSWLHRITGAFILWGGIRYLWQNLG